MHTKIIFQIFFVLMLSSNTYEEMGCEVKQVIYNNYVLRESSYADYKFAYHGVPSCASLTSDDDTGCCYIKVKFKNEIADEKYTHRGCIQLTFEEWSKIDETIQKLETNIAKNNLNVTKVDVDIDCNSKFIKLTGLILLAFLL
jgi:hypothetical protein